MVAIYDWALVTHEWMLVFYAGEGARRDLIGTFDDRARMRSASARAFWGGARAFETKRAH